MSDHLLILNDDEARMLGSLYSLGALAVLALSCGDREEKLFQESRKLCLQTLGLPGQATIKDALRDKIIGVMDELTRDATEHPSDA